MSHYHNSAIINLFHIRTLLLLLLSLSPIYSASIRTRLSLRKNDTSSIERFDISEKINKLRNITGDARDHFKSRISHQEEHEDYSHQVEDENWPESSHQHESHSYQNAKVVVLTSLSGIYVWWPTIFGGDDSFHLLLSQEDVPRFHDVTGDEQGHIYLTAPHERTVYRLQYSDGWWISNFSNHSVMNSIRNEMPLFLTLHHVSSILYVYGHSDIQTIDLLERPGARGSAPFMKRLRELSPNLRISDLIIDQLTSDGYIIGDSYGWCTVIRCALAASECTFLFKIPSSYDNRPYPCTATIDFSTKIIYLSLEEKIIGVYLNEQTNYDRRFVLTEKRGPRSTLGYDDIITYNQTILYTDVLRPLLHICRWSSSYSCINMSLAFSAPQRAILPLRLSIIQAPNFRPPFIEENENDGANYDEIDDISEPSSLMHTNKTSTMSALITDQMSTDYEKSSGFGIAGGWMLLLGIIIGLFLSAISFGIFYATWRKSPTIISTGSKTKSSKRLDPIVARSSKSQKKRQNDVNYSSKSSYDLPSSDSSSTQLLGGNGSPSITSSSVNSTTSSTGSSSYRPDTVL